VLFPRADTLASMARIETILKNSKGRLIIQHDLRDFAALPKFPGYLN
jgi:N-acyl homoserine lactone hydrolase